MNNKNSSNGFGLIEVLVALAIMAVGLLAVASFHSNLVTESGENKARSEAMALAQQRLEEIRNISNDVFNADDFDALFTVTEGYTNDSKHSGNNAIFLRQESVSESGDAKQISIMVSWVSATGARENVELTTNFGFESPVIAAEIDDSDEGDHYVRSATGRAELGEGQVTDEDRVTPNHDLTGLVTRGDGDLLLTSNDDVVLTLKDACQLDDETVTQSVAECTGFVQISGYVYIDRTTQPNIPIGEVYVKASDAAFCQRYYMATDPLTNTTQAEQVTTDSISALSTGNGDYDYFQYTCYLGGGWHGNIGMILGSGLSQSDKVCVGDPTSAFAFERPKIATRRVYRGMAFKLDDSDEPIVNSEGDIIYYSVGVKDALILPNLDAETPEAQHSFVLTQMQPGDNDGELCVTEGIMVRPDSNVSGGEGDLFTGNPDDFYCLNNNLGYVDELKLEAFGFTVTENCPFDPSDPPSQRHVISGNILVKVVGDIVPEFNVNTSDGPLNCTVSSPIATGIIEGVYEVYSASYECDVYDWSDPNDLTDGWNGYIQLNADLTQMTCSDLRHHYSIVKSDLPAEQVDLFECKMGNVFNVSGQINYAKGAKDITSVTTSDSSGVCLLDADGRAFECSSNTILDGEFWSGTITLTSASKFICISPLSSSPELTSEQIMVNDGQPISTIVFTNVAEGIINFDVAVAQKDSCP